MGWIDQGARKKLEAVARHWAGDRNQKAQIDRNVIDGLIAANAPPEIIAAAESRFSADNDDECEVWPENWNSVTLFLGLSTQWVVSPAGAVLGINYQSVESVMNIYGIKKSERITMFDDVRLMELTALGVLREKAEAA